MNTTAVTSAALTASLMSEREPIKLLRRIGSTTIEVTVHFSKTSKETMEDKLLRMLERAGRDAKDASLLAPASGEVDNSV